MKITIYENIKLQGKSGTEPLIIYQKNNNILFIGKLIFENVIIIAKNIFFDANFENYGNLTIIAKKCFISGKIVQQENIDSDRAKHIIFQTGKRKLAEDASQIVAIKDTLINHNNIPAQYHNRTIEYCEKVRREILQSTSQIR